MKSVDNGEPLSTSETSNIGPEQKERKEQGRTGSESGSVDASMREQANVVRWRLHENKRDVPI